MRVLFVCNGNVCRSAIAERLTRAFAIQEGLPALTAESAGTRALVGFPIEPDAARVIRGLGGNPDGFKARRLNADMVKQADLVLAMTESIRDDVLDLVLGVRHRTFTLLEARRIATLTDARSVSELATARSTLAVTRENISDPVGLSTGAFEETGDQIADAVLPLLARLHRDPEPVTQTTEPDIPDVGYEPRPTVFRRPVYRPPAATFIAATTTQSWY